MLFRSAAVENLAPARHPPRPVGGRVENRKRPAVRAARLMKTHVAIGRPGEVGGHSIARVGDELLLEGERPCFEVGE